jgi:hypothetical protein
MRAARRTSVRTCPNNPRSPRAFKKVSIRTNAAGLVAAHVAELVPLEEAASLGRGSRAAGELLVEADDSLHAGGVCGTADGLASRMLASRSA